MKIFFILVALLHLCDTSSGCNSELQRDWDFPGSDNQILFSPDAEHCQHLCTQQASCLFWAFIGPDCKADNRHFHCFLKATPSGKPIYQNFMQGTTAGYSLKSCNPYPKPSLCKVYQDVDFPGADYRTFFAVDYKQCQRACTDDPGCQFFSFLSGTFGSPNVRYKCHLKFSWTVPRTPNVIMKILIEYQDFLMNYKYFHPMNQCQDTLFPNTNFPGHDIEVHPAASPELCQLLCNAHPRCTYFSFVSNGFKCYLKNNPNEMVPNYADNVTSGLPSESCPLRNERKPFFTDRIIEYRGVDFPYSDIRYFQQDDATSCGNACTEDPNCQFYSYITTSHLCYLKRVITMPAPPKVTKQANTVSGFNLRNCPV